MQWYGCLGLGGSGLCAYKLFRSALWSIWSGVVSYVVACTKMINLVRVLCGAPSEIACLIINKHMTIHPSYQRYHSPK